MCRPHRRRCTAHVLFTASSSSPLPCARNPIALPCSQQEADVQHGAGRSWRGQRTPGCQGAAHLQAPRQLQGQLDCCGGRVLAVACCCCVAAAAVVMRPWHATLRGCGLAVHGVEQTRGRGGGRGKGQDLRLFFVSVHSCVPLPCLCARRTLGMTPGVWCFERRPLAWVRGWVQGVGVSGVGSVHHETHVWAKQRIRLASTQVLRVQRQPSSPRVSPRPRPALHLPPPLCSPHRMRS